MTPIASLRKFLASIFKSERSVESILNQHQKTIEALDTRASQMNAVGQSLEEEIAKTKAKLEKTVLERKRAEAAATAMNKVFGIANEITL